MKRTALLAVVAFLLAAGSASAAPKAIRGVVVAKRVHSGTIVLATGRKDFDPQTFDPSADLLPLLDGMTVLALVGIVDPPRSAAKTAIATAHEAGIQIRMITGDHAVTAAAIAKELGIPGRAISGAEFFGSPTICKVSQCSIALPSASIL